MKLIVISNPISFKGEELIVNQLFEEGMEIYHLRKENASIAEYRKYIEGIDAQYHHQIALHQHHELAKVYGINRLHYSESFRRKQTVKLANTVRSTSVHQLQSIDEIVEFNYAFFSPVFNSLSKPGYNGVINEDFRLDNPHHQLEIIALGGISIDNIMQIAKMGFNGAAVLGTIWNDPSNAVNTFKMLQREVRNLQVSLEK